jgi:hypothetical protein
MITLKEKKLLNEAVTGETKRCLAIVTRHIKSLLNRSTDTYLEIDERDINSELKTIIKEMVENSPYIKHHPELLKRIPND